MMFLSRRSPGSAGGTFSKAREMTNMTNQTKKEKAILELQEVLADAQEKAYALAEVVGFVGEGDDDPDEDFDPDYDESPVGGLITTISNARQQLIVIKRNTK